MTDRNRRSNACSPCYVASTSASSMLERTSTVSRSTSCRSTTASRAIPFSDWTWTICEISSGGAFHVSPIDAAFCHLQSLVSEFFFFSFFFSQILSNLITFHSRKLLYRALFLFFRSTLGRNDKIYIPRSFCINLYITFVFLWQWKTFGFLSPSGYLPFSYLSLVR